MILFSIYKLFVSLDISMTSEVECDIHCTIRPGGECRNGPPTGKFMASSELGQFWGAEFENRWYTDNGRGLQPLFHD